MSEIHDDGGAAFPVIHPDGSGVQYFGISIRDYFAAKAMQGILAGDWEKHGDVFNVSVQSYKIADGMLSTRNKESN